MRIETIVRAHSPAVASELCRAILSRNEAAGSLAAKKSAGGNNGGLNQYCLAKVVQFDSSNEAVISLILNELGAVAKTEHNNLLSIRKLHCGPMPSSTESTSMLCLAFEQCTTSLYQAIVDGYRNGNELSVRGLARKLNPHNGTTTTTAIQRINDMISGLQRLHFMGITHMRLCPTNILIDNESTFKIADFLGKFGIHGTSPAGGITPEYMATVLAWQPSEVIVDITKGISPKSSQRADVFSLACCIFYALTGQHPFGTFASGDRLAAGGYSPPASSSVIPLFVNGGVSEVIENIHSDYISNQHLLYNCPLVLDLCMRCLCLDPEDRLDVSELSRHPLFWDFDLTKGFILALPMANKIFNEFCNYEVIWKDIVAADIELLSATSANTSVLTTLASLISKYSNSVSGNLEFLIESWNSTLTSLRNRNSGGGIVSSFAPPSIAMMAPISALLLKVFDRFPHVLIRAWDGARITNVIGGDDLSASTPAGSPTRAEAFKRHHLHWMMLRSSAVTSISHSFVREYYVCVGSLLGGSSRASKWPTSLTFPDESVGLTDACQSFAASVVTSIRTCKKNVSAPPSVGVKYVASPAIPPRSSPPLWPASSPQVAPAVPCGTPGMKFLNPMIVKQMAAASAALTAVYENPELVSAISQKSGDNGQVNPHSQLVAAATIYASLLQQGDTTTAGAVVGSSNIW
jgi:serine/threonine protein kinase